MMGSPVLTFQRAPIIPSTSGVCIEAIIKFSSCDRIAFVIEFGVSNSSTGVASSQSHIFIDLEKNPDVMNRSPLNEYWTEVTASKCARKVRRNTELGKYHSFMKPNASALITVFPSGETVREVTPAVCPPYVMILSPLDISQRLPDPSDGLDSNFVESTVVETETIELVESIFSISVVNNPVPSEYISMLPLSNPTNNLLPFLEKLMLVTLSSKVNCFSTKSVLTFLTSINEALQPLPITI